MAIIDVGLNGIALEETTLTDGSKVRNVLIGDLDKSPARIICADIEAANNLYAVLTKLDLYTAEGF